MGAGGHALEGSCSHGELMLELAPGRNDSLWSGAHADTGFLQDLRP